MFTKAEIQVIARTLLQRREWLNKNMSNPAMADTKLQNQQTLDIIDSALTKLGLPKKQETAPAKIDVISTPTKPVKITAAQKRAQIDPEQMRVLVVDDDEFIGSLLKTILTSLGIIHVDNAEDGLKGISMLYDANPVYDLVLCDWNMPIKSGLDVHNAMRAAERYMDTCFILVTAVTEARQIRAAIDEGVDDYIVKPIEEEKIISKITRHFPKLTRERRD